MTMYIANPLYLPHTGLSIRSLSHFALLCRRFTLDELDGKEISKWQFIMHIDTCIISHMQFILALIKAVSCFIQACISFTMIINGWVYMFACAQFACQCLISKTVNQWGAIVSVDLSPTSSSVCPAGTVNNVSVMSLSNSRLNWRHTRTSWGSIRWCWRRLKSALNRDLCFAPSWNDTNARLHRKC